MLLTISHFGLAIALFMGINWIGAHSGPMGYISLGLFVRKDEAPAFNWALRLLSPVVFITVVSAVLYALNLSEIVKNIWHVAIYYVVVRIAFNVLMGRSLLINWWRETFIGATVITFNWMAYDKLISQKKTLLPDFSTATNELWVFVAVFVYAVINQVEFSNSGSSRRKNRYIDSQYQMLRKRYQTILDANVKDDFARSIALSILIYENFNRPTLVRRLERLVFPRFSRTLGPMQVSTSELITDTESVTRGCKIVADSVAKRQKRHARGVPLSWEEKAKAQDVVRAVAADYNRDSHYVDGVSELHEVIVVKYFPQIKIYEMGESEVVLENLDNKDVDFDQSRNPH